MTGSGFGADAGATGSRSGSNSNSARSLSDASAGPRIDFGPGTDAADALGAPGRNWIRGAAEPVGSCAVSAVAASVVTGVVTGSLTPAPPGAAMTGPPSVGGEGEACASASTAGSTKTAGARARPEANSFRSIRADAAGEPCSG